MSALPGSRAESCRHCGGTLRATAFADLFHCDYCDTAHLEDPGDARAFVPRERLGRHRLLRRLSDQLRELGADGHAVTRLERVWLPFWQIEATLAGWQRFLPAEERSRNETTGASGARSVQHVDEVVTRRVLASLPACDLRGWGVLGIADVVERIPLRPMRESLFERDTVLSVGVSRRAADRRVLLSKQTALRPRGSRSVRQHFRLMRPARALIYYPVWRVVLTLHGVPADAVVDGIHGKLLRARLPLAAHVRGWSWWGATAAIAWIGGVSPAMGALASGAWFVRRLGAHPVGVQPAEWMGWFSDELMGERPGAFFVFGGEES